ncbi:2-succinylbenzoate--CoA ligase [Termitomyces sp. T112]|nr:2-succinylbenzoate--CoA ligase [Termitomyces sp. T112]
MADAIKKPWYAQRTLAETDAIITAPGSPFELETRYIDGRLQRVYKRLYPSLRTFWLWAAAEHADLTYVVLENQRISYKQAFQQSLRAAGVLRDVYGVKKGDRVGICSRNYPDYVVAFWACHLIGAVSVLVNAWLPQNQLLFCLVHTECKVIILDPERADRLEASVEELKKAAKSNGILVFNSHEGKGKWNGMKSWNAVLAAYNGDIKGIETGRGEEGILPEDNAAILFTSGTTGMPKGVLSTQRQFLTNLFNCLIGGLRSALKKGENILPVTLTGPQKGCLLSVPFFHATGATSRLMIATFSGHKVILMRRWIPEEGARLIKEESCTIAGGVPSMVMDLLETSLADSGYPLESFSFGGAPAPDVLTEKATKLFPTAVLGQGYGMTETNSLAVGISGEDCIARPQSTGLPTPVNELVIVKGDMAMPPGELGEVWIRGVNVMKGYWRDPEATEKAVTKDGWMKTGDLGYLDEEGYLYVKDRIKDIIIRGGENIDSTTVENALYADSRVMEAAAVAVPHERLGEVVAAVVAVKPAFKGQVTEASLIAIATKSLPKFAVPVMVIVRDELLEKNASGKIVKMPLRRMAREIWQKRQSELKTKL